MFAERISVAIYSRYNSGRAFARAVGATYEAVGAWTSARAMPLADRLPDVCRALGVSADWLLGLSEEGGPDAARFGAANQ